MLDNSKDNNITLSFTNTILQNNSILCFFLFNSIVQTMSSHLVDETPLPGKGKSCQSTFTEEIHSFPTTTKQC